MTPESEVEIEKIKNKIDGMEIHQEKVKSEYNFVYFQIDLLKAKTNAHLLNI